MTNLLGWPVCLVNGIGNHRGHHRADEANAHDDDDFLSFAARLFDQRFKPGKFHGVIGFGGDGKLFAGRIGGIGSHQWFLMVGKGEDLAAR